MELTTGDSVEISAVASDQDGTVVSVSFYINGWKVAEVSRAPFAFMFSATAGSHSLYAIAIDNKGAATTSAVRFISVTTPPEVALKPAPSTCEATQLASVVDGDTILIRSSQGLETLRISQIDAPERSQHFGVEATACLSRLVSAGGLNVCRDGRDKYHRTIGNLQANGVDVGKSMVAQGCAWAYIKYLEANSALPAIQQVAKQARVGLWAGPALEPWIYRSGGSPVVVNATTGRPAVMVVKSNRGTISDRVFDWAEHTYTDLLINGSTNQSLADGTVYRCYSTNFCIGYRSGVFLTYDGTTLSEVGGEVDFLRQVEAQGF